MTGYLIIFHILAIFLFNDSLLFKNEAKELHTFKKTGITQSNKTKVEHFIQFPFHFADTKQKNLPQIFQESTTAALQYESLQG